MLNPIETATQPKTEVLTIAFQDFNGVYLAKISNLKDKETFAYGESKCAAEINALNNYDRKYNYNFRNL